MTGMEREGHFAILDGFPKDVVAVEAIGFIGRNDYEETLIPAIESRVQEEGKVKLLYIMGEAFEGFSAGAAWDDAKLGFLHMGDLARVGVVTDKEWIRIGVKLFAPLVAAGIRVFGLDELDAAKAWIASNHPEEDAGAGAAIDHPVLPLEDKMPPVD